MRSNEAVEQIGQANQGQAVDQADLKAVRGIGPKVEVLLKKAGIRDLGQLARTPVNEIASALGGLRGKFDTDRISRERWLTQAAALAAVPASARLTDESAAAKPIRHNFTVEVRMPLADRDIVSSKVVHVQTGDQETWTGWDPQRMVAFIQDRSGNRAPLSTADREPQPAPRPAGPGTAGTSGSGDGKPALHSYAMVPASGPVTVGTRANAAIASLTFDPATLNLSPDDVATVQTAVFARQLLAGRSVLVGYRTAMTGPDQRFRIDIPCDLSTSSRPITLFAVVRVLSGHDRTTRPSEGVPGASLTISWPA